MLDIAIAIGLGAITLITAYLGVHVTLHPADSDPSKRNYKVGFAVCAVIACLLIGVQAYRTNKAQTALDAKLGKIEKNTEEPAKVQVTNNCYTAPKAIHPTTRDKDGKKDRCSHPGEAI